MNLTAGRAVSVLLPILLVVLAGCLATPSPVGTDGNGDPGGGTGTISYEPVNYTHVETESDADIVSVSAAGGVCGTPEETLSIFERGGDSIAYEFTATANVLVDNAAHAVESISLTEGERGEYTLEIATAIDEEKPSEPCAAYVPIEVILRIPSEQTAYTVTIRENGKMAGVWRSG